VSLSLLSLSLSLSHTHTGGKRERRGERKCAHIQTIIIHPLNINFQPMSRLGQYVHMGCYTLIQMTTASQPAAHCWRTWPDPQLCSLDFYKPSSNVVAMQTSGPLAPALQPRLIQVIPTVCSIKPACTGLMTQVLPCPPTDTTCPHSREQY